MRSVYERQHDIDDVLEFMRKEQDCYSRPWREGNLIHIIKVPYRRKEYEKADSVEEKKKVLLPLSRGPGKARCWHA